MQPIHHSPTSKKAKIMDQPRRSMKFGKIISQRSRSVPSQTANERMQRIDEQLTGTERSKGKSQLSKCYPLNVPDSPHEAMEFLSRSWSPSSSNFFQILSTNSLVTSHENSESDEEAQGQERDKSLVGYNQSSMDQLDQLLVQNYGIPQNKYAVLSDLKSNHSAHQNHTTIQTSRVQVGNMKWLREEIFSSLSKSCRRKRKEVLRFHEAQIHAALAVARLAAAIAGTVANSKIETSYISSNRFCLPKQRDGAFNEMNTVVASAAALVATVCAEAAELIGAKRNQVTSAIRMGLESRSSADMLTLTATAATCLRGAAALKQRAESNSSFPEGYKFLQRGARMHLCMPTGKVQLKIVSISLKNDKIMLRLGTRHLRGALTTHEEYRIFDALDDSRDRGNFKDDNSFFCVTLCTTGGTIQLLFQDQNKCKFWNSTICDILSTHRLKHNY
ncbi:uncharacterized protein LOC144551883 [Carex rostrata]